MNDVRSTLIFSSLWGAAQTNYVKLQAFESAGDSPEFYILSQFDANARPALGSIHLLRGFTEGFPRFYPFIEEIQCIEEISQLQLADILREFPEFTLKQRGDRLIICHGSSNESMVEAAPVSLESQTITLSPDFMQVSSDTMVVTLEDGRIEVLTNEVIPTSEKNSMTAYQIIKSGTVTYGALSHQFEKGQIYNAPYSRFRFNWKEGVKPKRDAAAEKVRKEVSQLLFDHLTQLKQTHLRMLRHDIETRRLTLENLRLREEIEREYSFAGMIGQSQPMQDLFNVVRSIAATDVTVLIQGETGTGKEMIARAIHYYSPRKSKQFVAVNCGALSETLLESELFGHEKGAFTGAVTQRKGVFEEANGGSLFLDEIGEISPSTQVRLLRVLQDGEFQRVGGATTLKVDVRIVAATNQDLDALVKSGRFRQDLFYRLHVFPVHVPPLRERSDDIPHLISHFIEKRKESVHKEIAGISPQATASLMAYDWPGNIRELENVVQRMMITAKGDFLDVADLPGELRGMKEELVTVGNSLKRIAKESAGIIEKKTIVDALAKWGGNVTRAAKALGISRATLQNKMKQFNLKRKN